MTGNAGQYFKREDRFGVQSKVKRKYVSYLLLND